jgi:hypothetical protein
MDISTMHAWDRQGVHPRQHLQRGLNHVVISK